MATLTLKPQSIVKLSPFRFQVKTGQSPALTMDFEPIYQECQRIYPSEEGCLLHWQAMPFGERRWGELVWSGNQIEYRTWNPDDRAKEALHYLVQIDEAAHPGIRPTAVVYYPAPAPEGLDNAANPDS